MARQTTLLYQTIQWTIPRCIYYCNDTRFLLCCFLPAVLLGGITMEDQDLQDRY